VLQRRGIGTALIHPGEDTARPLGDDQRALVVGLAAVPSSGSCMRGDGSYGFKPVRSGPRGGVGSGRAGLVGSRPLHKCAGRALHVQPDGRVRTAS